MRAAVVATRFFLTVYGWQRRPNGLRTAHTFAEVTKTEYRADGSSDGESTLISWLPSSGTIHIFGAEPGRNYTMDETLAWGASIGAEVQATPATEILPELYDSFLIRRAELDSGSVLYIMNDHFAQRPNLETNCIHAVSDLPIALATAPMLDTGLWHGYRASWAVYEYLRPWFLDPQPVDAPPAAYPLLGADDESAEE